MVQGSNLGWDGNDDLNSGTSVDGKWHQYVGTYNARTGVRYLYIDGVVYGYETGNAAYYQAPGSHVCIGAQDHGNNNVTSFLENTMELYDARIWNYDLSPAQVQALQVIPVNSPGSIAVQPPANVTPYEGITVQIAATSGGGAPLTNQWSRNGVALTNGSYAGGIIVSGANTDVLTIANVAASFDGVFTLTVSNAYGGAISSDSTLAVLTSTTAPLPSANLVGSWLTGATNLADSSGFSAAGTHDAALQSGSIAWTNDVPPIALSTSSSLYFDNAGLLVSNTSTLDKNYVNTYDDGITNSFSVLCWAKGYPGGWNPWVSKYGESGAGWQLRIDNANPLNPTFTIRGTGGNEDMESSITSNDGNWHHYAGTYDEPSGTRNLYVDGALVASETGQGEYTESRPSYLMIGAKDSGGNNFGNYFTGEIYGVQIYNIELSQAQVNAALVLQTPSAPAVPTLTATRSGANLVLTWSAGNLLWAPSLSGPWTQVSSTSPYTTPFTGTAAFFKAVNP
jgi:hypothetical protein